ncbi:MAG: DsrE/DsrF/DrsH-like family protein [Gammaproteobacteria bacterium]|nr:DsrE/DsrF/DrsH-like family protein [Gammaproteobacteria bacterium]
MSTGKISVMVTSNKREQLQMAAMVASVGAVSGNDVSVFLSMNSLNFFLKDSSEQATPQGSMGQLIEEKNVPDFKDLFQQAVEYGDAKIFPCSMAVDILGIGQDDLETYISEPLGLTSFLSDASEGQVWHF